MTEMLRFGADIFSALDLYVQSTVAAVQDAREEALKALHQDVQRQADKHSAWSEIAPHIEWWDGDSGPHVGVRHPNAILAAQRAEYGDQDTAPTPLLRRLPTRRASRVLGDHIGHRLGVMT